MKDRYLDRLDDFEAIPEPDESFDDEPVYPDVTWKLYDGDRVEMNEMLGIRPPV